MTTWLSETATAQKAFPYSWTLSATEWAGEEAAPWAAAGSDGYKIVASLGWAALSEENGDASGTSGACVVANDAAGVPMTTGSPYICTLMNTDGNTASVGSVTTFGADVWGENFKGSNRGTAVEHTANLDAMKIVDAVVEKVDDEDAEEPEDDDSFEDADLLADDDGWNDEAEEETGEALDDAEEGVDSASDAVDGAVDDATAAVDGAVGDATDALDKVVEEVKAFAWAGPAATFQWYQPAKATTYAGLRRYEAGDSVTFYNVELTDDGDVPLPVSAGSTSVLNGASTLIAGAIALGVSTLAF
jgi:hypothetical protein